jgi:hypothetical protein
MFSCVFCWQARARDDTEKMPRLLEAIMELILVILAAGAVSYGYWRFSLRRHPYARCRWCRGSGRNLGSSRGRWGKCTHCGGTGRRLRWGARDR